MIKMMTVKKMHLRFGVFFIFGLLLLCQAPGDCFCKVNVQGSQCDECQDGFYDLTDANTNGCLGEKLKYY